MQSPNVMSCQRVKLHLPAWDPRQAHWLLKLLLLGSIKLVLRVLRGVSPVSCDQSFKCVTKFNRSVFRSHFFGQHDFKTIILWVLFMQFRSSCLDEVVLIVTVRVNCEKDLCSGSIMTSPFSDTRPNYLGHGLTAVWAFVLRMDDTYAASTIRSGLQCNKLRR